MSKEQEEDLLKRSRIDLSAREELLKYNLWVVASIAKTFSKSGNLTLEDAISEGHLGLLRAIKNLEKFEGRSRFYSFVGASVKHDILTFIRINKKRRQSLNLGDLEELFEDKKTNVKRDAEEKEKIKKLEEAISRLDQESQIVIQKYFYEGLTMDEIAEGKYLTRQAKHKRSEGKRFGRPNVYRRIQRSLEKLKEEFIYAA